MRIAVGQLWQETNTFNRNPTTLDDFEHWGLATGPEVIDRYGETGELGGFLDACRVWNSGIDCLGLARFACWPWGKLDRTTWSQVGSVFAESLKQAGFVDAVFLALHGAMAADGEDDVTGALLELVRRTVGERVPIVGTLDLHANVTPRMIRHADVLVGYHTCPHVDSFQTGQRAARALRQMLNDGVRPITTWRKLPMITAAENHHTFTGPPAPLYRQLERLEREEGVLSAGLYMAMPWFDCAQLGWAVTLTTADRNPRGDRIVDELAADCWDLRGEMETVERFGPAEVVQKALHHGGHPVVIGDGADATNSGAPGDGTHLLREFLKVNRIPHGALTFLVDPQAVALAERIGAGVTFDAPVGGRFAPEYSTPVPLRGRVERLLNVDFVLDGHIGHNLPIHMGRGAVVVCGDVTVLLVEKSGPGSSPRLYETAGLDPRNYGIVVAKSPAGFRADYESFAAGMYLADCPGCASPNWPRLNFDRVNRPLWPLDRINQPEDADWCRDQRQGTA